MTAYVIYHLIPNDRISDAREVMGVVLTGWQDADAIVDKLNDSDPDRRPWSRRRNYWKEEISIIDIQSAGLISQLT